MKSVIIRWSNTTSNFSFEHTTAPYCIKSLTASMFWERQAYCKGVSWNELICGIKVRNHYFCSKIITFKFVSKKNTCSKKNLSLFLTTVIKNNSQMTETTITTCLLSRMLMTTSNWLRSFMVLTWPFLHAWCKGVS